MKFHSALWKWTECAVYCNHWSIETIETQLSGLYLPHVLPYWGNEAKPVRWKMNSTPAARVCRLGASGWVSSKTRRPQVIIQMGHSAWEKKCLKHPQIVFEWSKWMVEPTEEISQIEDIMTSNASGFQWFKQEPYVGINFAGKKGCTDALKNISNENIKTLC